MPSISTAWPMKKTRMRSWARLFARKDVNVCSMVSFNGGCGSLLMSLRW